jgi:peptidoglycan hydrolase-like protein with peptidoglycan-binding domain
VETILASVITGAITLLGVLIANSRSQAVMETKVEELPWYGADGEYGSETENALLLFQEDRNLEPDAKCGKETWSALLGLTGVG